MMDQSFLYISVYGLLIWGLCVFASGDHTSQESSNKDLLKESALRCDSSGNLLVAWQCFEVFGFWAALHLD